MGEIISNSELNNVTQSNQGEEEDKETEMRYSSMQNNNLNTTDDVMVTGTGSEM